MNVFERAYRLWKVFGLRDCLELSLRLSLNTTSSFCVGALKEPITLRPRSSDAAVFYEVFLKDLYGVRLDFVPDVIVDAGANVGMTSIYFANLYPSARIIALEPIVSNFEVLLENTKGYTNIECLNVGLWSHKSELSFHGEAGKEWGYEVRERTSPSEGTITAIGMRELLEDLDLEAVDVLKIDIEGSEREVFDAADCDQWLSRVRALFIEIHDRKRGGGSKAVFGALSRGEFCCRIRGDNLVCRNLDLK